MKSINHLKESMGVKNLPTNSLKPNPHNPRQLFDEEDMVVLRESISKVGILVPLAVYLEQRTGNYVILDGQRRWMCAEKLGLKTVPVNEIAEPTLAHNIITMFQIHKFRKDWELMPTALSLEFLMKEMNEKHNKKLSELTGLNEAVVVRCKKLLSYPKKYQDMMLEVNSVDRVKADFFIELYSVRNDREVNKFKWYKKDKFTDDMLKKYRSGGIISVTAFRKIKQYISNSIKAEKILLISKKLQEFASDPDLTPDHLNIGSAQVVAKVKRLIRVINNLHEQVEVIAIDEYYGEEEMWSLLEKLSKLIHTKLRQLGRGVDE